MSFKFINDNNKSQNTFIIAYNHWDTETHHLTTNKS